MKGENFKWRNEKEKEFESVSKIQEEKNISTLAGLRVL